MTENNDILSSLVANRRRAHIRNTDIIAEYTQLKLKLRTSSWYLGNTSWYLGNTRWYLGNTRWYFGNSFPSTPKVILPTTQQ